MWSVLAYFVEATHMYATRTYFFQLIGSCSNKTEKGTFFLSILLSLKTIGKGVKFSRYNTDKGNLYKHNC